MTTLFHKTGNCFAVFFLLLITAAHSNTTDYKIDSLREALDTASTPKLQVDILNQLTNSYLYRSTDTSNLYVDKSLHLARANHLQKELGVTYRLKGLTHFFSGRLNEAIQYFDSSLTIRKELRDVSGEVLVLNNIAFVYQHMGNTNQSKELFFKALALSKKNNFLLRQADIYNNLGILYKEIDKHDSALYYYQKALKINKSDQNRLSEVALLENNIATIYFYRTEFLKAFMGYQSAYDFAIKSNNDNVKRLALFNIGVIYVEVGLYKNAISIYNQLLNLYNKAEHESNRLGVLFNLANAHYKAKNYNQAIHLFATLENQIDSSQFKENSVVKSNLHKTYTYLALSYNKIKEDEKANDYFSKTSASYDQIDLHTKGLFNNEIAKYLLNKEKYKEAESYLMHNLTIDRIDSFPDLLLGTYSILLEIHKKEGKAPSSFRFKQQHEKYKQIVSEKKRVSEILRNAIEFDSERRELELLLMNKENIHIKSKIEVLEERKRKQFYLFLLLLTTVTGIFVWWYISQKNKREKSKQESAQLRLLNENEKLKSESLKRELELKQKEVVSQALQLAQKNEAISALKEKLTDEFRTNPSEGLKRSIQSIESQISTEQDWKSFRISFESVYENFFDNLKTDFPELTTRELQLCSLLRLNMSIKKMSSLLGISEEGAKKARYRIRKKLNMTDSSISLSSFLMKY